ncbi:hypothetical protein MtrunA17_Chr2g0278241 [Medicago truncatula]|uniref:Transmembrane protein n=1 Tax=Medicago truncatula TaxID=3880 RepID=A0A396J0M0_MEDTR|nr:hypothetical protein MtrunA17_Chr2g0278241 [Medicago truncatula]
MTIHRPVTTHLHRRHRRLQPLQPTSSFFLSVKHSVSSQNKMKAQPREGNGQMAPDPSIREPRRGMRVKITNRSSPQTLVNRPLIDNDRCGIFWMKIKSLYLSELSVFFLVYLYLHSSIGSAKFMY